MAFGVVKKGSLVSSKKAFGVVKNGSRVNAAFRRRRMMCVCERGERQRRPSRAEKTRKIASHWYKQTGADSALDGCVVPQR